MHHVLDGMYNGATLVRSRFRSRVPLPSSAALKSQIRNAAFRWSLAAVAVCSATIALEALPIGQECAAATRSAAMLRLWVVGASLRVLVAAIVRGVVYWRWDTHATVDMQPYDIFMLLRLEFVTMLVSVLWTTIGFMYVYSASESECRHSPLTTYAMVLVVLLYAAFLIPILLTSLYRCVGLLGLESCVACLRGLSSLGLFYIPSPPVREDGPPPAVLRLLTQEKYREGRFSREEGVCSICMAGYAPGDILRVLPCAGAPQHHFHRKCIDEWLQRTPVCPLCRTSMREEDAIAASFQRPPPTEADTHTPVGTADRELQQQQRMMMEVVAALGTSRMDSTMSEPDTLEEHVPSHSAAAVRSSSPSIVPASEDAAEP